MDYSLENCHSISVEPMPLRVTRDLQGLLDFVNDLSGRRRRSVLRDIIRQRETHILLVATRSAIVRNNMPSRPSPKAVAAGEQKSHRSPDILLQNFFIIRVAEMLPSPVFQLLGGKGKPIYHMSLRTSLWCTSLGPYGGVCHSLDDGSGAGSGHFKDSSEYDVRIMRGIERNLVQQKLPTVPNKGSESAADSVV
jgi:hypothetical protein